MAWILEGKKTESKGKLMNVLKNNLNFFFLKLKIEWSAMLDVCEVHILKLFL